MAPRTTPSNYAVGWRWDTSTAFNSVDACFDYIEDDAMSGSSGVVGLTHTNQDDVNHSLTTVLEIIMVRIIVTTSFSKIQYNFPHGHDDDVCCFVLQADSSGNPDWRSGPIDGWNYRLSGYSFLAFGLTSNVLSPTQGAFNGTTADPLTFYVCRGWWQGSGGVEGRWQFKLNDTGSFLGGSSFSTGTTFPSGFAVPSSSYTLTQPGAPARVEPLTLTATSTSLTAVWAPPPGTQPIEGYDSRLISPDGTQTDAAIPSASVTALSHTFTGLTSSETYGIRIRANNDAGDGPWSVRQNVLIEAPAAVAVPDAPAAPTVAAANQSLEVSWVAPEDNGNSITHYDVRHKTTAGTTWTTIETITGLTRTITGLTNGTSYDVQVRAANSGGDSAWSPTTAATPMGLPGKPAAPTIVAGAFRLGVTWTAPTGTVTHYDLGYRKGTDAYTIQEDVLLTEYVITGLDAGTAYDVRVRAVNDVGNGAWSDTTSGTPIRRLDAPPTITVDVAFAATPATTLTASDSKWHTITTSNPLREFKIKRGRAWALGQTQAGKAKIVVENSNGYLDPENASAPAPYRANDMTRVLPMRPVRIRVTDPVNATVYTIFRGYVERWGQKYPKQSDEITIIEAVDGFKLLAQASCTAVSAPVETAGARLARLLDMAAWPGSGLSAAGFRDLDTGSNVAARDYDPSMQVLSEMRNVERAELGSLFMSRAGAVTFRQRTARFGVFGAVSTTWSDDTSDTNLGYTMLDFGLDDDRIINRVIGDNTQISDDSTAPASTSIAAFGPRAYRVSPLLLPAGRRTQWANNILRRYSIPHTRVRSIAFEPRRAQSSWAELLGAELGVAWGVIRTPPSGHTVQRTVIVESLEWTGKGTTIRCKVGTSDETRESGVWILGVGALGTDDDSATSTRLAVG